MTDFKANPGGNISLAQTIGRDALCAACWKTLERQSLRLENERRLGKTTVLRKLQAETPKGTRSLLMEIGGLSSTTGFIEELIDKIDSAIPEKGSSFRTRANAVISAIAGVEIAGVRIPAGAKTHWRVILLGCFDELMKQTPDRIVFFWDEMPWMLHKIKETEGMTAVVDLMDTLRDVRQTHDRVRMVLTGSIGFHHILGDFEEKGIPARIVNDMRLMDIPPLDEEDARDLAQRLLKGENIEVDDMDATTKALYDETGGVAFYIHSVISNLAAGGKASVALVRDCVFKCLTQDTDPWEMRHFDTRIKAYYGAREHVVRAMLDKLAASEECTLQELASCIAAEPEGPTPAEIARDLLRKMGRDHYVVEQPLASRRYRFKFALLKRWWQLERSV